MKNRYSFALLLTVCLASVSATMASSGQQQSALKNHGIANGLLEAVLPSKAIIHAQIRNVQSVLENIEQLAVDTLPDKALPTPLQHVFQSNHPLLTLLGMPTVGAPLTSDTIAEKFGIDSESAISLTLYPGDPTRFFILSLGMADPTVLTQSLDMVLRPEIAEDSSIGGRTITRIRSNQLPMRDLYLGCSENRAYVTGEPSLLLHLFNTEGITRLKDDAHLGQVLHLTKGKDLVLTFNSELVKPLLTQLSFFKYVPLTFLAQARNQFLNEIPEDQKKAIEQELWQKLGVESLEEVVDYAECFVSATYEQVFDFLYENINGMRGATLALSFDHAYPELSAYAHHEQIDVKNHAAPIPLAAVRKFIARLSPGSNHLTVSGKKPMAKPSPWVSKWLGRVRTLITNKGLDLKVINAIQSFHEDTVRPSPINAHTPWTAHIRAMVNPKPPLSSYDTIETFITAQQDHSFIPASRNVTVIPKKDTEFLRAHFQNEMDARKNNRQLAERLFQQRRAPKLILNKHRLMEETLPGNVAQFTIENAYISQIGLFGYNQHEFINRKIYYAKEVGDYLTFHKASGDATWLGKLAPDSHADRASSNLEHLINRLPKDVNYFSAHRMLHGVTALVQCLQDAESLVHRDIQEYLARVERRAQALSVGESLADEIKALTYSPVVASINQDDSGQFYCLLPGNLTFPREKITPAIGRLFEDFNRSASKKGGLVAYSRTLPGTKEWTLILNTEGLSGLIKSVGNAIFEEYITVPDGKQAILKLVMNKRDFDPARLEQVIARNPNWSFLDQIQMSKPRPKRDWQAESVPPIPDRRTR
ncbi:MAG: hypothetical protein M2R45_01329 [Verrucomicrobia subdivision 3 bacterium]|nr:hypothetical protein [Limisphaerales bacterium]MCS1415195.1 hypothetical protein [Limisphaerales bacterium]